MHVVKSALSTVVVLAAVVAGCGSDEAASTDPGASLPTRDGGSGCGCTLDGACKAGTSDSACGQGGGECTTCTGGKKCIDGQCRAPGSCGPSSCKGCCRPDDTCAEGTSSDACGTNGALCETCSNAACAAGKCQAPCGPTNCLGCCKGDGTCLTGKQPDDACGSGGKACSPCGANEVCSSVGVVVEGSPNAPVQAGACMPKECAACAPGCCATTGGGGVACLDGTDATACGGGGTVCSVCGSDATCSAQKVCVPNPDVVFKLVLVGATVPAEDANGSSWDYLSNPDVGITVRLKTTPETVSVRVDGPDNTTIPTFATPTALSAKVSDFKKGIFFDLVDRDTPDPDDPIGTVPAVAYVPSDNAFVPDGPPLEVGAGELKVRFYFVRQ